MGVIILQGDAQAGLIENMLLEQLGAEEIERRRLICGNPYSFQGDERHIIFLSMVAASNERIGAYVKPADQRRFNVAASRAQDQMWLFHSVTLNDLSTDCLRRRLLEYFINPTSIIIKALGEEAEELRRLALTVNRQIEKPPKPYDSWFEVDVALQMASRGYRVIPQYPALENKRIDFVIEGHKGQQLAVECYGDYWHGIDEYEKDMERQRMLERCGWNFHIIRECNFYANQATALENLWEELKHRGILPIGSESSSDEVEKIEDVIYSSFDSKDKYDADNTNLFKTNLKEKLDKQPVKSTPLFEDANKYSPPSNIQEALKLKVVQLQWAIIETLKKRPNNSCVKDDLPTFVLKEWQIITRGAPREFFNRRINRALKKLADESVVEIYKSKNIRVRLVI